MFPLFIYGVAFAFKFFYGLNPSLPAEPCVIPRIPVKTVERDTAFVGAEIRCCRIDFSDLPSRPRINGRTTCRFYALTVEHLIATISYKNTYSRSTPTVENPITTHTLFRLLLRSSFSSWGLRPQTPKVFRFTAEMHVDIQKISRAPG